jgi:hypothetical protein
VIAAVGTTANDPLAAVPLLWAVAMMTAPRTGTRRAALAAFLWGVSVAFKWSNGLAIPLLLLWWWQGERRLRDLPRGAAILGAAMAGFCVAYVPWGLQLWQQTGNPFHPLFAGLFQR